METAKKIKQIISSASSTEVTLDMLESFRLVRHSPFCPECGSPCKREGRKMKYVCRNTPACAFEIDERQWDLVLIHAAVADVQLKGQGIEHIIYEDVPIDRETACSPTHFLPLLVQSSIDLGKLVGGPDKSLLKLTRCSDKALEQNEVATLIGLNVMPDETTQNTPLSESLHLLIAATNQAILKCKRDEPGSSAMNATYIYDWRD